jgi:hypothetical protein
MTERKNAQSLPEEEEVMEKYTRETRQQQKRPIVGEVSMYFAGRCQVPNFLLNMCRAASATSQPFLISSRVGLPRTWRVGHHQHHARFEPETRGPSLGASVRRVRPEHLCVQLLGCVC